MKQDGSPKDAIGGVNLDKKGPTAEDDIRGAIARHGIKAVQEAVKSLATPSKRGRRRLPDWKELRPFVEKDAREWLAGGNPFSTRTNYAVAKAFAKQHGGQSAISTHQRIERKLAQKPYDRTWHMLVAAYEITHDELSYLLHLKALTALAQADTHIVWKKSLLMAESQIARYLEKVGEPPCADATMAEIRQQSTSAYYELLSVKLAVPRGGLMSLARDSKKNEH